jgi:hypothetical protein
VSSLHVSPSCLPCVLALLWRSGEGPGRGLGTREALGDPPPSKAPAAALSTGAQAGELPSAGCLLGSNHERHRGSNTELQRVSGALRRRSQNRVRYKTVECRIHTLFAMFSAHRILPKTCDLGSLCHQHLNQKSSKNGIRQTLQKRYPKISKQTHTQRPQRIPKVTQNMYIYINISIKKKALTINRRTDIFRRNCGRVWILARTPKLKNKKWRAFRPVCYTFWGVRNPAEYRENPCGSKIKNNRGRSAVYFILLEGVGTQKTIVCIKI